MSERPAPTKHSPPTATKRWRRRLIWTLLIVSLFIAGLFGLDRYLSWREDARFEDALQRWYALGEPDSYEEMIQAHPADLELTAAWRAWIYDPTVEAVLKNLRGGNREPKSESDMAAIRAGSYRWDSAPNADELALLQPGLALLDDPRLDLGQMAFMQLEQRDTGSIDFSQSADVTYRSLAWQTQALMNYCYESSLTGDLAVDVALERCDHLVRAIDKPGMHWLSDHAFILRDLHHLDLLRAERLDRHAVDAWLQEPIDHLTNLRQASRSWICLQTIPSIVHWQRTGDSTSWKSRGSTGGGTFRQRLRQWTTRLFVEEPFPTPESAIDYVIEIDSFIANPWPMLARKHRNDREYLTKYELQVHWHCDAQARAYRLAALICRQQQATGTLLPDDQPLPATMQAFTDPVSALHARLVYERTNDDLFRITIAPDPKQTPLLRLYDRTLLEIETAAGDLSTDDR